MQHNIENFMHKRKISWFRLILIFTLTSLTYHHHLQSSFSMKLSHFPQGEPSGEDEEYETDGAMGERR